MVLLRYLSIACIPILANAHYMYSLHTEYAGPTFFDDWDFFNNLDNLTNGNANYVSRSVALGDKLAFVRPNGNAVIKVDNNTTLTEGFRNTIRIQTNALHGAGSLVWPAWWSGAPDWPASGEIDTFEYVNMMPNNQMALHTQPGCTLDTSPSNQYTGIQNSTECSFLFNQNQGCVIQNPNSTSYGAGFAAAGGGVFVTEFAHTGVAIWFFTREKVPPMLLDSTNDINTTMLGRPLASWPNTTCDMSFMSPQHLTLNIDLCGDYAGNAQIFAQTCSGNCYHDYVLGPPSTYDNAYFEIKSIRTYIDPAFPHAITIPAPTNVTQAPPPVFTANALSGASGGSNVAVGALLGMAGILGVLTV
ncbi:hypothetical protein BU17DRAFT_80556 [Hysterangium stoloniferum]|nr:hypothetical protein BU17DRAFT_80556 [Hysterangium stoloniferum]